MLFIQPYFKQINLSTASLVACFCVLQVFFPFLIFFPLVTAFVQFSTIFIELALQSALINISATF